MSPADFNPLAPPDAAAGPEPTAGPAGRTLGWAIAAENPYAPTYLMLQPGNTFWSTSQAAADWAGILTSQMWRYTVVEIRAVEQP